MPIQVGDRIPNVTLRTVAAGREREVSTDELFRGKRAVLFAVPGLGRRYTVSRSARNSDAGLVPVTRRLSRARVQAT